MNKRKHTRRAEAAGFRKVHAYLMSMAEDQPDGTSAPHHPGFPPGLSSYAFATNGDAQKLARHLLGIMERAANQRWFATSSAEKNEDGTYRLLVDTPDVESL